LALGVVCLLSSAFRYGAKLFDAMNNRASMPMHLLHLSWLGSTELCAALNALAKACTPAAMHAILRQQNH